MKKQAFTVIELLVVIALIAILMSLLFPAYLAQLEAARIEESKAQLRIFEAALAQYEREFGACPPSYDPDNTTDNAGIENMLACLRTTQRGGPFIKPHVIATWLGDTDADGRQELVDPWKNPWVYFHSSDYYQGAVYYMFGDGQRQVMPAKKGDVFLNLTTYQLWSCGANKLNETGQGDDVANVGQ